MTEGQTEDLLDITVSIRLDRLLDNWAEEVVVYLEKIEAPFMEDIHIITEDLGYEWWRGLTKRFSFRDANVKVYPSWPVNKEAM
ncbi:hypothetical protein AB6A23_00580 [Paenibacillus tarimensis]